MATMHSTDNAPVRQRRVADERLFQLLFWVSFPLFFALALGSRVLPGSKSGDDGSRSSVLAEAAAAARSTIAIALTD